MKITSAHAIAFLALVVAVGGGIAVAHNGDTDKIHFCISNAQGGNVRAVPPDTGCAAGETSTDVRVQNVAYHERTSGPKTYAASKGNRLASKQLLVPANGDSYIISGKVVVSKPRGSSAPGVVTCRLTATDNTPSDVSRVSLDPGEVATLALETTGKTDGRPGQTAATEIGCGSRTSRFTVAKARITAVPVNTLSKGVPVG